MPEVSLSLDARGNALFAGTGNMDSGLPGAFLALYDTHGRYISDKVFGGISDGAGHYAVAFGGAADMDQTGSVVFAGELFGNMGFEPGSVLDREGIFLMKLDSTL